MATRRTLLPLALVALVLLAGCAGLGGDAGGGGDGGGAAPGDGGGDAAAPAESGQESAAVSQPLQVDRAIVRTGTVEIRVTDFRAASSSVARRARGLDGYVSGSDATRHTKHNDSWTTGRLVVRVPTERFGEMLAFAKERGTVLHEETRTEDVTDQLVDLEARLENSKARRERLRSFYERANSTGALLEVEETLSAVQERIERLQAKQRSLQDRVAYATLTVRLREPEPGAAADTPEASLVSTFVSSTETMVDYAYGSLLAGVRLSPYLVFLALPALGVWAIARRRYAFRLPLSSSEPDPDGESATDEPTEDDS